MAARVDALPDEDFAELLAAVAARRRREETECGTFDEAADAFRPRPPCPECGAPGALDGRTPAGHRRLRCTACGKRYAQLSGTVFDNSKKDLATWVDFIRLAMFAVPLDACAEMCRIGHQTAWEWRHRLLRAVDGHQDRIVPRGRVWIDETYVNDTDLSKGYGEARKRGLSGQKICIAVGIDERKEVVAVVCGHGKPSSARIREALKAHIERGSTLVHDRERAHGVLVREPGLRDESYKADVRDRVYLDAMRLVNDLCSWLKRYLWRFTGMDPKYLQSYLNLHACLFQVKRDDERWPKIARVVRHLLAPVEDSPCSE